MQFLVPQYDPLIVIASIVIACIASYIALDLTKRVREHEQKVSTAWWIGGSIAMGSGIWSMHFIGMLAYRLPIELGYNGLETFTSWFAAVAVSAIALRVAARGELSKLHLLVGALSMAAGICAMHYTGMAALELQPGIVWNWGWVAISVLIAITASAAALVIFFLIRKVPPRKSFRYQLAAAVVMGAAISGMHYSAMAAVNVVDGTVCFSAGKLGGNQLVEFVATATIALLGMTLFTSSLDARMQSRTAKLARSLQTANQELELRAFYDPLTRLPNRLLLDERLQHALVRVGEANMEAVSRSERVSDKFGRKLALLFIDLDGFKPINDSIGHAAGDEVLREVACRLTKMVRDSDTVSRMGGDEFVVLLEDVVDVATTTACAQRIIDALMAPIQLGERTQHIGASVGIAIFPEHGPGNRLMSNADAAMYEAKRSGGNTYVIFQSHMEVASTAANVNYMQSELRQAIQRRELTLHYQPKFDRRQGRLRGVEALLRWTHPEMGEIPPGVFIQIAEKYGLISALGSWVIEEACRQMNAWADQNLRIRVAINLSVHQLRQIDLVQNIEAVLHRYQIDPSMLLCEITESVAMEDVAATQKTFEKLSQIGVYLSIDDFGTGYSSLAYLRQLPARQLKIDRSFINDIESSKDARAIVDAVIKLAHALDLIVVAEGVETDGQRAILEKLNCDELQGFLFARP
ncbi:MAG: EAL domain-containing protein, partial [Paucibacter sp.]|nr:EAL domain-containing protein [Roseateles sp.]